MPVSERWNSCPAMTGCPQSWQTPSTVTNDLRRILSAVSVSSVRMASACVRRPRIGEVEKTSGRFRDKGERLLFFKGRCLTHRPRASTRFVHRRNQSPSRDKPLQCFLRRNENCRNVFELDQTVLLPHFSITRRHCAPTPESGHVRCS